jgi:dephospho-CoA kinase
MLEQQKIQKGAAKRPFVVALTGGIASGKSTVSHLFAQQHGVCVVDADIVAREVVAIGEPALLALVDHFGEAVLSADGSLNRAYLKDIIFAHPSEREWVNELLHPVIRQRMMTQLSACQSDYAVAVIPLLAEAGVPEYVNFVLVVDCEQEMQYQRLLARDEMPQQLAESILSSQASRKQRLALAQGIIVNDRDTSQQQLQQAVADWHQSFLFLVQ